MSDFKTFQERRDQQDHLGWDDVHFSILMDIKNARVKHDYDAFIAGVDALEMSLEPFKDDEYRKDLIVYTQKERLIHGNTTSDEEFALSRFKSSILMNLLGRVNRGEIKVREKADDSRFVKELAHKLLTGTGQNVFITGKQGSGKSWASLRLAELVTNLTGGKFNAEHIAFDPRDFTRLYNDRENVPEHSAIMFDEAGVTYGSKDSMSKANKVFSSLIQTIRHRKLLVIFNSPDLGFVDKTLRKSLHWWLETERLNKRNKTCHIKPHYVDLIQETGEIIYPYPRFGAMDMIKEITFGTPSSEISTEYEKKAREYKDMVGKQAELKLAMMNPDNDPEYNQFKELMDSGLKRTEVRDKMGISDYKATKHLNKYKHEKDIERKISDKSNN